MDQINLLSLFQKDKYSLRLSWLSGMMAGQVWVVDDLPIDQSHYEKHGLCWYSDAIDHDVAILGQPTLHCTVAVENSDTGVLIARLCDVFLIVKVHSYHTVYAT